jgi:hypothetical protein
MNNFIAGLVGLTILVASIYGWIANFIAILAMNADTQVGWIIGRIIGVFVPFIGAVLGYF